MRKEIYRSSRIHKPNRFKATSMRRGITTREHSPTRRRADLPATLIKVLGESWTIVSCKSLAMSEVTAEREIDWFGRHGYNVHKLRPLLRW